MIKQIFIFLFLIFFNLSILAQSEQYSAPIEWERYKVTDKEVSVLFPKLPVAYKSTDDCNETENFSYWAYADEIVYLLNISSKTKDKAPKSCIEKGKYNKKSLNLRINEIKKSSENIDSEEFFQSGKKVIKLSGSFSSHWLFDDLENDRWFELYVWHRNNAKINLNSFFGSISFDKNPEGVEIGDGSLRTLGDKQAAKENSSEQKSDDELKPQSDETYPLWIVTKPRPRYTDMAREKNVQGTVTLRVTFLSNGGIGDVTPVETLGFGLTEQAMAAAYKIAFIPAKRNGKNIAVAKPVQFSFSIY